MAPSHSSPFSYHLKSVLAKMLFGSTRKKFVTFSVVAIICYLIHLKNKKSTTENIKLSKLKAAKEAGKGNVDKVFWQRIKFLVKIVIPTWKCVEVFDLLLLTLFLVFRTFLSIYLAGVNGRIVKAIIEMDFSMFIKRVINLALIAVPASFVNSFLEFLNKRLAINFKRRLTEYFHRSYLKDMIFYQLSNLDSRVSNPDQRLTSDIDKWAGSMSVIYSNFSKPLLDIIMFSRKLSELVGWAGPGLVVLWYLISGVIIKFVSPPFGKLTAIEQRLEGVYRASHTDLVHHAEYIAFYKGNEWEKSRINNSFSQLTKHSESIINKKLYMGVFDSMLVKYGAVMVGYAVVGLPVFGPGSKEYLARIGSDSSAITRDYVRNSSLLINLAKAIGRIVISYKEIQQLAGYTSLVYEMKEVLDDLQEGKYVRAQVYQDKLDRPRNRVEDMNAIAKGRVVETEDVIRFDRVPIVSPNGDILLSEITFEVEIGKHTMITGPNGCGKSSLFRVLGGLWPLVGGVLYRPHMDKLFYIPQRPYLPPGTLREQIIYPHNRALMIGKGATDSVLAQFIQQLEQLLREVKLEYLVGREEGGFDAINDWNDVLSGGEKQRIAMARLFYHRPLFAILDECTSAVSVDVEAMLYTTAKEKNITLITVSHRSTLFKFHDYMLKFDGEGGWQYGRQEPITH